MQVSEENIKIENGPEGTSNIGTRKKLEIMLLLKYLGVEVGRYSVEFFHCGLLQRRNIFPGCS